MTSRSKSLHTKSMLLAAVCALAVLGTPGMGANAHLGKKTISDATRAVDTLAVQNVMGRHAFYHGAGKNCDELKAIWATKSGDDTFSNPHGSWVGMKNIYNSYCLANTENQKKALEALRAKYPEIKDSPESYGVGDFLIHTLTTPIIEIAGDGKSAKGMWYSPGVMVGAKPDGTAGGIWFFEKYGVDFVKEDGQWKIWHIQMFYDFTGPLEHGLADVPIQRDMSKVEAGEKQFEDPLMKQQKLNPHGYKDWSPTTVPVMIRTPEPYYTFGDTFSY